MTEHEFIVWLEGYMDGHHDDTMDIDPVRQKLDQVIKKVSDEEVTAKLLEMHERMSPDLFDNPQGGLGGSV